MRKRSLGKEGDSENDKGASSRHDSIEFYSMHMFGFLYTTPVTIEHDAFIEKITDYHGQNKAIINKARLLM